MKRRHFTKILAAHLAFYPGAAAVLGAAGIAGGAQAAEMDRTIAFYAHMSTDKGLRFLRTQQGSDGSWQGDIGLTALALRAFVTSYRRYTVNDGPFVWKPAQWLANSLGALQMTDLDEVPTGDLAAAITTLRILDDTREVELIEHLQSTLAARRPDAADPVNVQYEFHQMLIALAGLRTDWASAFRSYAGKTLVSLQLPQGGFPGPDGAELVSMSAASAVSLGLTLQGEHTEMAQAALTRTIETYAANTGDPGPETPVFFGIEALQTAMTRAERRARNGDLGDAKTWRDTLTYALLEVQAEDGGWLSVADKPHRIAATARAVNAINNALPAG